MSWAQIPATEGRLGPTHFPYGYWPQCVHFELPRDVTPGHPRSPLPVGAARGVQSLGGPVCSARRSAVRHGIGVPARVAQGQRCKLSTGPLHAVRGTRTPHARPPHAARSPRDIASRFEPRASPALALH